MRPTAFLGAGLRRDMVILLGLAVLGMLLPAALNRGLIFIAGLVWINAVFGLSFNLLFGLSGVLSFGQAMFFAAGAYGAAVLTQQWNLPFLVALPLAGLIGALIAACVGAVALRRSEGVYFAILTLAFAELLHLLIVNTAFLGRNDGLSGLTRPVLAAGRLAAGPGRRGQLLLFHRRGVCAADRADPLGAGHAVRPGPAGAETGSGTRRIPRHSRCGCTGW